MAIEQFISKDRVRVKIDAQNWQDLIDQVGDIMVASDDVLPSYIPAMKKVTKDMGPYSVIAPGVVLLHARPEDGVKRICLAIATLKEGIMFGSKNDPVHLAIGLGAIDHESHIGMLRDLATLLQNKEKVQQIINCSNRDELISTLLEDQES